MAICKRRLWPLQFLIPIRIACVAVPLGYWAATHAASFVRCSIELTISYVYLSLHSYADRDNVGLPGFAAWFKDESDGERDHAQLLLNFQVGWPRHSVCRERGTLLSRNVDRHKFTCAQREHSEHSSNAMHLACGKNV